jgi:hypothetical protein
MVETYYIRLPFFLINGTETKTVNISFDNVVVSSLEVTSSDVTNPNMVTLPVSKEPGIYELKVSPGSSPDMTTTVCLNDIWVSNDNTNFYSVIVNYIQPNGAGVNTNLPNRTYGFDPAKGACLYEDFEFKIGLDLVQASSWSNKYKSYSERFNATYAAQIADPTTKELYEESLALFGSRGYN